MNQKKDMKVVENIYMPSKTFDDSICNMQNFVIFLNELKVKWYHESYAEMTKTGQAVSMIINMFVICRKIKTENLRELI